MTEGKHKTPVQLDTQGSPLFQFLRCFEGSSKLLLIARSAETGNGQNTSADCDVQYRTKTGLQLMTQSYFKERTNRSQDSPAHLQRGR